jgi:hypothetical protein
MWRRGYRVRLVIQGPSADALRFLQQRMTEQPFPWINHVACAVDFEVPTKRDAEEFQRFIDAHLYKPHHRPGHGVEVYANTTTYFGFNSRRYRISTYADKVSRHTGSPCAHLECRFQSASAVRAVGISSIADLLAFDFPAFWTKRLRLYEYDPRRLARRWNRKPGRPRTGLKKTGGFLYDSDQQVAATILTLAAGEGREKATLMELLMFARAWDRSLAGVLVPINTSELLAELRTAKG